MGAPFSLIPKALSVSVTSGPLVLLPSIMTSVEVPYDTKEDRAMVAGGGTPGKFFQPHP